MIGVTGSAGKTTTKECVAAVLATKFKVLKSEGNLNNGFGMPLQLLKLEIGGGGNSSDGAEPSIEPVRGEIDCNAGYEFAIAKQAAAVNPYLKLYGLQWSAPGWVGDGTDNAFTSASRETRVLAASACSLSKKLTAACAHVVQTRGSSDSNAAGRSSRTNRKARYAAAEGR